MNGGAVIQGVRATGDREGAVRLSNPRKAPGRERTDQGEVCCQTKVHGDGAPWVKLMRDAAIVHEPTEVAETSVVKQ